MEQRKISDDLPLPHPVILWTLFAIFTGGCSICAVSLLRAENIRAASLIPVFLFIALLILMLKTPLAIYLYRKFFLFKYIDYLEKEGVKTNVKAEINPCTLRNSMSKGSAAFMFESKAKNPLTGKEQTFKSEYLNYILLTPPFNRHLPQTLTVIIDPKNARRYYVDISPVYRAARQDPDFVKKIKLINWGK